MTILHIFLRTSAGQSVQRLADDFPGYSRCRTLSSGILQKAFGNHPPQTIKIILWNRNKYCYLSIFRHRTTSSYVYLIICSKEIGILKSGNNLNCGWWVLLEEETEAF